VGQVTAARGEVEDLFRGGRCDEAGRLGAPEEVTAPAQEVICQVIATRNVCESPPDKARILLWKGLFDGFFTRMGRAGLAGASGAHERIRTSKGFPIRS